MDKPLASEQIERCNDRIEQTGRRLDFLLLQKQALEYIYEGQISKEYFDLAIWLHSINCEEYHLDGCSWKYEDDNLDVWIQETHRKYLIKAYIIIELTKKYEMNIEDFKKIHLMLSEVDQRS